LGWVQRELDELGIPPLKRLGQRFLVDTKARDEIINAASLTKEDTVLEIGPGLGFLTKQIATKSGKVMAIEKDRTLAAYLSRKFSSLRNLTVVEGDFLRVKLPAYDKIVSSPPYNISSKLIVRILEAHPKCAVLLLQEEFVKRLTAPSGSKEYGRISVMLQSQGIAEYVAPVERSSFQPRPRVDSAITRITFPSSSPPITNMELFTDLVRNLFSQRRRNLERVVKKYLFGILGDGQEEVLSSLEIPKKRVYELRPEEFVGLANEIHLRAVKRKAP